MRMRGGMRSFLRRGKFVPSHSELEDFLLGRISREQGMRHIREAVQPAARTTRKLRAETLEFLHAWDLVYLDRLAEGRLVPGEPTSASEALHNLSANEALLLLKAKSRRLVAALPPIIQRGLQARVKRMVAAWEKDEKEYGRLFSRKRSPKSKVQGRKSKARKKQKKARARAGKRKR